MSPRALLLLPALLVLAGCGPDGPRRYEVSGAVLFGGEPVPAGTLLFEPDTARGNRGPGVMVEFRDGRYRTPPGQGVVGGPHLVRVTGFDGKGDDRGESQLGRPLFAEQVIAVDLPHQDDTRDFDIPAAGR